MLNWKKIQDLNLKEVANKTQIELDFLEALVEKNFAVLHRFNVRGFVKILSREYELDFSDFNEEYERYVSENNLNLQTKNKMVTPKLDVYTQKSSGIMPIITVVVIVIVGLMVYYFDTIESFFDKTGDNNSSSAVVEIIGEAKNNLKKLDNTVVILDNNKNSNEENDAIEGKKRLDEINFELNTSKIDDNLTHDDENLEKESLQKNIQENHDSEVFKEAQFKIKDKIWIGLIDLQTFKKMSFLKQSDFNISLDTNQLILTGAAALVLLDQEGKELKFPAGNSKRFLIQDGKIKSISLTEFLNLNKGKGW